MLATDIDASAVRVARANARLNRTGATLEVVKADGVTAGSVRQRAPFDLVFANILARPLRRMARDLSATLAPGGEAILSGLLLSDRAAVAGAYRACGLTLVATTEIDGWATLRMRRGAPRR